MIPAFPQVEYRAPHGLGNVEYVPGKRVIPRTVFAAGRQQFEFVVRGFCGNREAKILAFKHLPLAENGWSAETARCRHLRNEPQGCVFLIERD